MLNKFQWQRLIASKEGPDSSTTRHILLTLSVFMDEGGDNCFPSTKKLSEASSLSERCVCEHLCKAADAGWITKIEKTGNGQSWKRHSYKALIPKKALTQDQYLDQQGTDAGSVPYPKGTDSHDMKALTQDQSTSHYTNKRSFLSRLSLQGLYVWPSYITTFCRHSRERRLAEFLFNHIKRNDPKAKRPNIQKWSEDIDKLLRIDGRSVEEAKAVIMWSQADEFWKSNILSAGKLRKQFPSLMLKMKNCTIGKHPENPARNRIVEEFNFANQFVEE